VDIIPVNAEYHWNIYFQLATEIMFHDVPESGECSKCCKKWRMFQYVPICTNGGENA